jgi:hypothetical protein
VCATCPNASDSNTGTSACPVRTIARGLQNAATLFLPRVRVASVWNSTTAQYTETLTVPPFVMVEGKWRVTGTTTLAWARSTSTSDRTVVIGGANLTSPTATRMSGFDGFAFRPTISPSMQVVTVSGSPTLRDFSINPTVTTTLPNTITGIWVSGASANPLITGDGTTDSSISIPAANSAPSTPARAIGLYVADGRAEVSRVTISGFNSQGPGSSATGIELRNAPGTSVTNTSIGLTGGATCVGVHAIGNTRDIVLDTLTVTSCGVLITSAAAIVNYGVAFDSCPVGLMGAAPVLRNSIIVGRAATSGIVGVRSADGCGLTIQGNSITGYTQAAPPPFIAGVVCESGAAHDPCRIVGNSLITPGSLSPQGAESYGVVCRSTCNGPNGPATTPACQGSCAEISDNRPVGLATGGIQAGAGATRVGVLLAGSNPLVARNGISGTAPAGFCTGYGVRLVGSGATVVNNAISAPACTTMVGVQAEASVAFNGFIASPLVHSNTVVAWPLFIASPVTQAAVRLSAVGAVDGGSGEFRNNLLQIGPANAPTSAVFLEASPGVDPVALTANDYWFDSDAGTPTLYLDENAVALGSAAAIDALTRTVSSGNQRVRPGLLVSTFPHLLPDAGVQRLGTSQGPGAPTNDYDGDPRPLLEPPDIGADELP